MENVSDATKVFTSLWEQLINAPSHVLLGVALFAVGMLLGKSPIPNWIIPWILVIGGALLYPRIASAGNMDPSFRNGSEQWVLGIFGGLLGIAAVAAYWLLRKTKWFVKLDNAWVNSFRAEEDKIPPQ